MKLVVYLSANFQSISDISRLVKQNASSLPVIFLPDLLAARADPQAPFTAKKQHKAFLLNKHVRLDLIYPRFNFVHN